MQPVKRATVIALDKGCSADIGVDHGFFNDLVGLQPSHLVNAGDMALLNLNNTLSAIKVQATSSVFGKTECRVDLGQV